MVLDPQAGAKNISTVVLDPQAGAKNISTVVLAPQAGANNVSTGVLDPRAGVAFLSRAGARPRGRGAGSPRGDGFSFSPRLVEESLMPAMRRAVRERRRREKTRPARPGVGARPERGMMCELGSE